MKFIIRWNTGYGDSITIVEADDYEAAESLAYEQWREEAENQSDYEAMEYTEDNCYEYGLGWDEE